MNNLLFIIGIIIINIASAREDIGTFASCLWIVVLLISHFVAHLNDSEKVEREKDTIDLLKKIAEK